MTREIVLLLPGFGIGGLERNALRLVEKVDPGRFRFSVAALDGRGPMRDAFEARGAPTMALPFGGFATPSLLRARGALRGWVAERGAEVVHAFNPGPTLLAALSLGRGGPALLSSRRSLPYHGSLPAPALWWSNRRCRWLVANSRAVEEQMASEPGVDRGRLTRVATGVELPDEAAGHQGDGDLTVAWVAGLRPVKRPELFVEAFARALRAGVSLQAVVVGDGVLRASLEERVARLHLSDRVRFLGYLDDPSRVLRNADVFVLTSSSEGLPTAVLEAMAHGLPVIATAVGGTSEAVVAEETGLLVPPGDPAAVIEAVADALVELAKAPDRAREMGRAGRRRVETEFDETRMIQRMEELYASA